MSETALTTQPFAALVFAAAGWVVWATRGPHRRRWAAAAIAASAAACAAPPAVGRSALALLAIAAWVGVLIPRRGAPAADGGRPALRGALRGALRLTTILLLALIILRPGCGIEQLDRRRPLLVVALDQSQSMSLSDGGPRSPTRAARVASALRASAAETARLAAWYDIRLLDVGGGALAGDAWRIDPRAPSTALEPALRAAAVLRDASGRPPAALLLISDGGENTSDPEAVERAAVELAERGAALLAIGVGPRAGSAPLVMFDPLVLPARVAFRELLRVAPKLAASGCGGHELSLEALWGDELAEARPLTVDADAQRFAPDFELAPPSPGVHRLTFRVRLPAALGGETFSVARTIEVSDERVRVLMLERAPTAELAFAARAIEAGGAADVVRRFDAFEAAAAPPDLSGFDVIVLAVAPPRGGEQLFSAVAQAASRGVGVLLAGGRSVLNSDALAASDVAQTAPVALTPRPFGVAGPLVVAVEPATLRAGVFSGALADAAEWRALPPLESAAALGPAKPAAQVLATIGERPLLAAQRIGRGRCVAAAWEESWRWALHSDEAAALHAALWRQLVAWLANRRPQLWVIPDRLEYPLDAVRRGESVVRLQIGMTGLEEVNGVRPEPSLVVYPVSAGDRELATPLVLSSDGGAWRASWPRAADRAAIAPGAYIARAAASPGGAGADRVEASARFELTEADLERRAPTSNLVLLERLASAAGASRSRYADVEQLPDVLRALTVSDPTQPVKRVVRLDPVAAHGGLWLTAALALLLLEWSLRRRAGLR